MIDGETVKTKIVRSLDVIIVGAGFAGLYMMHKCRELGLSAKVLEMGADVGGTWYWNRYPGARCDVESLLYSYSFDKEIEKEWRWTERYPTQKEISRYLKFVADKLDLRRDIQFETKVTSAIFESEAGRWTVATDSGDEISAQFVIMATGALSTSRRPEIAGINDFEGETYHTARWPNDREVDLSGKRIAVIGTGSSGIQFIPPAAKIAKHVTVFQRTPNYSVPACNAPLSEESFNAFIKDRERIRIHNRTGVIMGAGDTFQTDSEIAARDRKTFDLLPEQRRNAYEVGWQTGGSLFAGSFRDIMTDKKANASAAAFHAEKVRAIVKDPKIAVKLIPKDYPFGAKRLCIDTDYYATFNRDNVDIIDIKADPIERITANGIDTDKQSFSFDVIVYATGFDAFTGTLFNIDIRGADNISLTDAWRAGPRSYLGLMVNGFPNLFLVTGAGSPSVLSNMVMSIEFHVEVIADCINHLRKNGLTRIEASKHAQNAWVEHVNDVANMTLFVKGASWYLGANVPGKPRVFMPYAGGVGPYRNKVLEIVAKGYKGFDLGSTELNADHDTPQ